MTRDIPSPTYAGSTAHDRTPIVRLVDLTKTFGPLRVLEGVTLDFERGKTTVILGPSGAGKSVMLKHMVGLLEPDRGQVFFDGDEMNRLSESELVERRKRIGFLFQMGALFDSMTIGENIAFPLLEHTKLDARQREQAVAKVLAMVGLSGLQPKMPAEISGGQRKRVALARAIVMEPSLVLYDEPTTGLDPIRADLINELIVTLGRHLGISSIVVTHDMASANKIADRMVLLYDGRIVCDGTPQQFVATDNDLVQRFIHGRADQADLDSIRAGFESGTGSLNGWNDQAARDGARNGSGT